MQSEARRIITAENLLRAKATKRDGVSYRQRRRRGCAVFSTRTVECERRDLPNAMAPPLFEYGPFEAVYRPRDSSSSSSFSRSFCPLCFKFYDRYSAASLYSTINVRTTYRPRPPLWLNMAAAVNLWIWPIIAMHHSIDRLPMRMRKDGRIVKVRARAGVSIDFRKVERWQQSWAKE